MRTMETTKRNSDTTTIDGVKKIMVSENNTPETRKNDATITVESDDDSDRENAQKQWLVVSDEGG
jgi:hypothetical protein